MPLFKSAKVRQCVLHLTPSHSYSFPLCGLGPFVVVFCVLFGAHPTNDIIFLLYPPSHSPQCQVRRPCQLRLSYFGESPCITISSTLLTNIPPPLPSSCLLSAIVVAICLLLSGCCCSCSCCCCAPSAVLIFPGPFRQVCPLNITNDIITVPVTCLTLLSPFSSPILYCCC